MEGTDQQFILRWHFQESTLLNGLPKLLDNELFTDITLSVGCKKIKAHKIILATCSSYFLQLFQDMDALQHPVIILQDTDYNDLNAIISFIYRGQCLVTEKQLPSVIAAAKLLQIRGLCDFKVPESRQQINEKPSDLEMMNVPDSVPVNNKIATSKDSTNHVNKKNVIKTDIRDEINVNTNNNVQKQNTSTICDKIGNTTTAVTNAMETDIIAQPTIENNFNSATSSLPRAICPICNKILSNQYNLRVHLETHRGARHACPTCTHVSRSRDALRKHVAYRHPGYHSSVAAQHGRKRRGMGDV